MLRSTDPPLADCVVDHTGFHLYRRKNVFRGQKIHKMQLRNFSNKSSNINVLLANAFMRNYSIPLAF